MEKLASWKNIFQRQQARVVNLGEPIILLVARNQSNFVLHSREK